MFKNIICLIGVWIISVMDLNGLGCNFEVLFSILGSIGGQNNRKNDFRGCQEGAFEIIIFDYLFFTVPENPSSLD